MLLFKNHLKLEKGSSECIEKHFYFILFLIQSFFLSKNKKKS